jgi:ketosteroid isomerase-like protein
MSTPLEQLSFSAMSQLYKEHIGFIKAKNVDGLLAQYDENLLLISTLTEDQNPLYVRGHQELEEFFKSRIFSLQDLEVELNQWAETDHVLMMVEKIKATTVNGDVANAEFYDNWYLENGQIKIHFAGVVQYPDGTYADDSSRVAEVSNSPIGQLYREHIGFIRAKNLDGLLNQYSDDPLLISTLTENRKPLYIRGREALREFFESRIFGLDDFELQMNQWAEGENCLMVTETLKTRGETGNPTELSFYDNWVLKDGKITTHFAGVVRYPDGSYQ